MGPNVFVPIALSAFVGVVVVCLATLPARRAVLLALLGGWLFLPQFDGHYRFLFFNSKGSFVPTVVLLGSVLFDGGSWARLRPRLLDLPVAVLCVQSYFTATQNGFDVHEAARSLLDSAMEWGAPYLLGRVYFGSPRALKDLAKAMVGAALVYVLPCLWEIRMSPQLHETLYGFRVFGFGTAVRFGGYRPSVFMQHGLALALFMAIGTLISYWLWRTARRTEVAGLPMGWTTLVLAGTTVLCKSTGATILLALGIAVLEGTRRLRIPWLLLAVLAVPVAYCAARITGWNARTVVELSRTYLNDERAQSLEFRLDNEDLLVRKAMGRPWLGWGRFGRSFVYGEEGQLLTVTDSMWVIVLGTSGLLGLGALGAALLAPVLALLRRFPARSWRDPRLAPASALAVSLTLWTLDDLLNAMWSPLYLIMAGALVSFAALPLLARSSRWRSGATAERIEASAARSPR